MSVKSTHNVYGLKNTLIDNFILGTLAYSLSCNNLYSTDRLQTNSCPV